MEYPAAKGQEQGKRGQDVALYSSSCTLTSVYCPLTLREQMLTAIGETFDPFLTATQQEGDAPQSLITGVIVSTRPQFYRVSIWTRTAPVGINTPEDDKLRARIEAIGKHFKTQVLGYGESQKLGGPLATEVEFVSHKDSERKGKGKKIVV